MVKLFSLIVFIIFFSVDLLASKITVDFKLTPAGSFVAQTSDVKGKVYRYKGQNNGEIFFASNIEINLLSLSSNLALRDQHMREKLTETQNEKVILIEAKGMSGKGEVNFQVLKKDQKQGGKKIQVKTGSYKIEGKEIVSEFVLNLKNDLHIDKIRHMGVGVKDEIKVTVRVPFESTDKDPTAQSQKNKE